MSVGRRPETLTRNDAYWNSPPTKDWLRYSAAFLRYRPEVDILPGGTWKCSMRSAFYWFAEFCHSQRLSHFAASFIVTRAEGSIAKSCKNKCLYNSNKIPGICVRRIIYWQPRYPQSCGNYSHLWVNPPCERLHALTIKFRFKVGLLIV